MSNFGFPQTGTADDDYAEQVTHDALVRATDTAFGRQSADTDDADADAYTGPWSRPNTPEAEPREYPAEPDAPSIDSQYAVPAEYGSMSQVLESPLGRQVQDELGSLAAEHLSVALSAAEDFKNNLSYEAAAAVDGWIAGLGMSERRELLRGLAALGRRAGLGADNHQPPQHGDYGSGNVEQEISESLDKILGEKISALARGEYEAAKKLDARAKRIASRLNYHDADKYRSPLDR